MSSEHVFQNVQVNTARRAGLRVLYDDVGCLVSNDVDNKLQFKKKKRDSDILTVQKDNVYRAQILGYTKLACN